MNISEVAKLTDLTPPTLRYYEKEGLIPPVKRVNSNREYSLDDVNWIEFIKCMRASGFSIVSLVEYIGLFQKGDENVALRKKILMKERANLIYKRDEINQTIQKLNVKIENYEKQFMPYENNLSNQLLLEREG